MKKEQKLIFRLLPLLIAAVIAALLPQMIRNEYYMTIACQILIYLIAVCGLNFITGLTGQMNLGTAGMFAMGAYVSGLLNVKLGVSPWLGLVAALCVALMLLGAVIPIAMFIAPAVAGFLVATVCVECGMQLALTAYAAVSLLALLFVPDKEVALIFVFLLGYYPLAKPKFERIRPAVLRIVCKLLLCNGAVLAMYGLVFLLVPAGSISQELRTTALAVSLATLAMGNVAFVLYDRALHNMLMMYRLVWRPKLHKTLGWR